MKKNFWIYMAVAFGGGWIIMILGSTVLLPYFGPVVTLAMFTPLLGTLAACGGLGRKKTGIGWRIGFKKNWKYILIAWFAPALITLAGALLYFAIFPDMFDANCGYMALLLEQAGMEVTDGIAQGMPLKTVAILQGVQAITWAPLVNGLIAMGEETGWRGYMTPALQECMGKKLGLVVSGVIWGIWHAPAIVLAGYEYGTGYFGAPVSGVLLFAVVTVGMGTLLTWMYERTDSIWVPSIFHGAFNAIAAIPLMFTTGATDPRFIGPAPNGLISMLPMLVLALFLLWKGFGSKPQTQE